MFQHGTGRTTPPPAEPWAGKPQAHPYFFSSSLDGKTFLPLPPTTHPETLITGLTPNTMVGVRVNLNISTGPGEWSPMVSIPVH